MSNISLVEQQKMKRLVDQLVSNFSYETLCRIFEIKNPTFIFREKTINLEEFKEFKEKFVNFEKISNIGNAKLDDDSKLAVFTIKVNGNLTERSSKKRQFELAKKIFEFSEYYFYDAGFFIFYDENKNFRFSFVCSYFKGKTREYSSYKRYTYYVDRDKPNRTFKKALIELELDSVKSIISAFNVQPLIKEFYTEIQNWYAWALKSDDVWFPGGKKEENLIRLITRLIFVWFLKEMKLVPSDIFEREKLKDIVENFRKGNYYYNVILQNLFFATLNRPIKERAFAKDKGYPKNSIHFGLKSLYRYEKFLKISEEDFIKLFEKTPFINGGLFECLDEDSQYVDGFSRNENKRAKILDEFFFGEEREVDLSEFYGTRRIEKVRGLIDILKDYNFTADENSPVDVEVSLDPELLGHIFENLLASYNEETQTTARKATGSYYTPKEIVDFMVEESLKEYFKNKTGISQEKIEKLLSYEESVDILDEEKDKIINAIDELKVLDPAVGSGAFPMGVLHKLVNVLEKIDPDNEKWYELQYQKALKEMEEILRVSDKEEKDRLLKELNENFDESITYPDYARKLYVIQNSIYGVDIQNIAVQLTKLRFFLSLIVDQKSDLAKENLGIKPLPHLETNFITANTLINLESSKQLGLADNKLKELKEELKKLYKKHFTIKTRKEKEDIKNRAKETRKNIKERLTNLGFPSETAEKIANFDIFDQLAKADWFNPEWMFAVENGFDIVIGNPPYVRQERIRFLKPLLQKQGYETFVSTADLYVYFYERGYNLLKDKAILAFITSNKWMRAKYGQNLRRFLKEKTTILEVIDFGGYAVFQQTVDTCIVLFRKEKPSLNHYLRYAVVPSDLENHSQAIEYIKNSLKTNFLLQTKLSENSYTLADDRVLKLKEKIESIGRPLKEWNVNIYRGVLTGFNDAFIITTEKRNEILANCKDEEERRRTEEIIKPILRGRDIGRYYYKWAGLWLIATFPALRLDIENYPALKKYFLDNFDIRQLEQSGKKYPELGFNARKKTNNKWFETQDNIAYYPEFEKEKIVWQRVSQEQRFAIVPPGLYCEATTHFITGSNLKFLIGVLNSSMFKFAFYKFYMGGGIEGEIKGEFIGRFPIPPITPQNQHIAKKIEDLVNQILSITQSEDYLQNQEKQELVKTLEKEIDKLVYKLYELTEEEIRIVEGEE